MFVTVTILKAENGGRELEEFELSAEVAEEPAMRSAADANIIVKAGRRIIVRSISRLLRDRRFFSRLVVGGRSASCTLVGTDMEAAWTPRSNGSVRLSILDLPA